MIAFPSPPCQRNATARGTRRSAALESGAAPPQVSRAWDRRPREMAPPGRRSAPVRSAPALNRQEDRSSSDHDHAPSPWGGSGQRPENDRERGFMSPSMKRPPVSSETGVSDVPQVLSASHQQSAAIDPGFPRGGSFYSRLSGASGARRRMRGVEGWGRHIRNGTRTAATETYALTHPSNLRERARGSSPRGLCRMARGLEPHAGELRSPSANAHHPPAHAPRPERRPEPGVEPPALSAQLDAHRSRRSRSDPGPGLIHCPAIGARIP
jgi:hypothetical protein